MYSLDLVRNQTPSHAPDPCFFWRCRRNCPISVGDSHGQAIDATLRRCRGKERGQSCDTHAKARRQERSYYKKCDHTRVASLRIRSRLLVNCPMAVSVSSYFAFVSLSRQNAQRPGSVCFSSRSEVNDKALFSRVATKNGVFAAVASDPIFNDIYDGRMCATIKCFRIYAPCAKPAETLFGQPERSTRRAQLPYDLLSEASTPPSDSHFQTLQNDRIRERACSVLITESQNTKYSTIASISVGYVLRQTLQAFMLPEPASRFAVYARHVHLILFLILTSLHCTSIQDDSNTVHGRHIKP